MKFKLRMVVEATYEVSPNNYGKPHPTPQEMLNIDIDNVTEDPMAFIDNCVDQADMDVPGYTFEVTGEVVEE